MARNSYRQFLRLLERWPIDESKKGRDLGEYMREQVTQAFRQGEATNVNEAECQRIYNSLNRLANNTYGNKYKQQREKGAMGIKVEDCRLIMSNEFLKEMDKNDYGLLMRLKGWVGGNQ